MFFESRIHIEEENALLFEIFSNRVVHSFAFVLSSNATKPFLFCFRNSESIERALNVIRYIVPILLSFVGRPEEVRDVVKINTRQGVTVAPSRHFAFHEVMIGLDSDVCHPCRLSFEFRDVSHDLFTETFVESDGCSFRVMEPVLVITNCVLSFLCHCITSDKGFHPIVAFFFEF